MPWIDEYKTGERPMHGDIVRGIPNQGTKSISGIVVASQDGLISIVYLRPGNEIEADRLYGETKNFELIARNE
jgi:hypothetical protein